MRDQLSDQELHREFNRLCFITRSPSIGPAAAERPEDRRGQRHHGVEQEKLERKAGLGQRHPSVGQEAEFISICDGALQYHS